MKDRVSAYEFRRCLLLFALVWFALNTASDVVVVPLQEFEREKVDEKEIVKDLNKVANCLFPEFFVQLISPI